MNKVLVEVFIPAASVKYDVYIPLETLMSEVVHLLAGLLNELSEGKFIADDSSVLCDIETGIIYDTDLLVDELGIKNGTRLMFI